MAKNTLMAGASRFAHLAGFARKGARAEEDRPEDDEPKGRKGRAAEDDEPDEDEPKGRKGRAAEDDEPDEDEPKGRKGRAAEDDEPDEDEPKGKKGRAAAEDDEDDEDDEREARGSSASARAWRKSQARCAAIFATAAAAANPALAASLAFETTMPRSQAIAVLKSQGTPSGSRIDDQRRRVRANPDLDASAPTQTSSQAAAAGWERAMTKVHGKLKP